MYIDEETLVSVDGFGESDIYLIHQSAISLLLNVLFVQLIESLELPVWAQSRI